MIDVLEKLQTALADQYTVERELGAGGMATVYLAHDLKHDRKVALKVMRPELAEVLGGERFLKEITVTAKLQHPRVVALYDSGEADGLLYYVMPFVDGESLRDRLNREGQIPSQEAAKIASHVASALAYAHRHDVVHRDIKPENILLSAGEAVVADFGIARATQAAGAARLTQTGLAVGTPAYMSPEQASGELDVGAESDLYSLGCVFYEMVAGSPPFTAETPRQVVAKHVMEDAPHLSGAAPDVRPEIAAIIGRLLKKEPEDRFPNAETLVDALDGLAGGSSTYTPVSTSAINVSQFVRNSSPVRVGATFAVIGVGIVGIVYLLMMQLGLPDWTLWGAGILAMLGVVLTAGAAKAEQRGGTPTLRQALTIQFAGTGLLTLTIVAYSAMRALGIGPAGSLVASGQLEESDRVILAEFANATSDSALGETVTELLRVDFSQSPTLTLMESPQIMEVLRRMELDPASRLTEELATEVAQREGVKAILTGEIRSIGDEYVVSARVVATATGETLTAGRETAGAGSIVEAVDNLSAALRRKVGESLRTIRSDPPLARVTTRSNQALRLYAQADRANNLGQFDRALGLLQDATREDSMFAMAYRKYAIILMNQNRDPDSAQVAFTKAHELRDRLTERERYLAEAAYYSYVLEDLQRSSDEYTSLLEKYPTDGIALNNLAVNHRVLGREADAEELYRRSIANGGAPAVTYTNAVGVQYDLGLVEEAEATFSAFVNEYPEHPNRLNLEVALASAGFDYEEAERAALEWRESVRGVAIQELGVLVSLANLASIRGRMNDFRRLLGEAYEAQEAGGLQAITQPRELLTEMIASLVDLLFLESPDNAVARIDRMRRELQYRELPLDQRDDLQLAEIYARANRVEQARELIALYEQSSDEGETESDRSSGLWATYGALSIAEQRFEDAIREFSEARLKVPSCKICFLHELGEAYAGANQLDSAVAQYERYLNTPTLNRLQMDNFNLWAVLLGSGQGYEALGREEEAIEAYNRLLELWQEADPEVQGIVDDVRGRIARLVAEGS